MSTIPFVLKLCFRASVARRWGLCGNDEHCPTGLSLRGSGVGLVRAAGAPALCGCFLSLTPAVLCSPAKPVEIASEVCPLLYDASVHEACGCPPKCASDKAGFRFIQLLGCVRCIK